MCFVKWLNSRRSSYLTDHFKHPFAKIVDNLSKILFFFSERYNTQKDWWGWSEQSNLYMASTTRFGSKCSIPGNYCIKRWRILGRSFITITFNILVVEPFFTQKILTVFYFTQVVFLNYFLCSQSIRTTMFK